MACGGRSLHKTSDESFDFICTACSRDNKTVEGVRYCIECYGYCCQPCVDIHKKFPALMDHNLLDASLGQSVSGQQPRLPEFPTERCRLHKGKVMDLYCDVHDEVGCSTCFAKNHRSCGDSHIHSIPDAVDAIFDLSECEHVQKKLENASGGIENVSRFTDVQIQGLNKELVGTINRVDIFQKVLEAKLKKSGDFTREHIYTVYNQLKGKLQEDNNTADAIGKDLKTAENKLTLSRGNRAQRFVVSKDVGKKINQAKSATVKQLLQSADMRVTFIPDQPLADYINGLQEIGQVQRHQEHQTLHPELYKVKASKDINIKLADDYQVCDTPGSCLTENNQLLITDSANRKIKLIDLQKMAVIDSCSVDAEPRGVCCINKDEAVVACWNGNKIQFVSIKNKMTLTRQMQMSHRCYGIAYKDSKLYVTAEFSLCVYTLTGTLLNTISDDNSGNTLFIDSRHIEFNADGSRMYVACLNNKLVCFDGNANYINTMEDLDDIQYAYDSCEDGRGNLFILGVLSRNVVQYHQDGRMVGIVLKQEDGLQDPYSVTFRQAQNQMFVTMGYSNVVKMYELE